MDSCRSQHYYYYYHYNYYYYYCYYYSLAGSVGLALCHTLVTIATQIPNVLQPLSEEIVSQFAKVIINADDNNTESKDLVVCCPNKSVKKVRILNYPSY